MTTAAQLRPGDRIIWTVSRDSLATVTEADESGRFTVEYVETGTDRRRRYTVETFAPDRPMMMAAETLATRPNDTRSACHRYADKFADTTWRDAARIALRDAMEIAPNSLHAALAEIAADLDYLMAVHEARNEARTALDELRRYHRDERDRCAVTAIDSGYVEQEAKRAAYDDAVNRFDDATELGGKIARDRRHR